MYQQSLSSVQNGADPEEKKSFSCNRIMDFINFFYVFSQSGNLTILLYPFLSTGTDFINAPIM